ncbi:hypothetical protein GLOIN_2v1475899 [Rhizophagus clarus]|uniref:Uncharacterized protein n=1 Tax=Rhizophagus clarus TaxID=94130 RepID=A0A8H3QJB6_9GLOM|nr:hypothetical protein GLOIN_2v1475899 [Rhizophagus clarus]
MPSPACSFVAGILIRPIYAWGNYLDVGVELDMTVSHNTEYISDIVFEPLQIWKLTTTKNYCRKSIDIIKSTGIRNHRIIGFLRRNDIACTNPGMQNYQINIPSNLLFYDFPGGVPQGTPNNFNIDLWEVQQQILCRLE